MRLLVLALTFSFLNGYAQHYSRPFTFNDIGWTIDLPEGFELLDSTSVAAKIAKGRQTVESTSNGTISTSETKPLIVAKKNESNYFISSLTPFDEGKDGSWTSTNREIRQIAFKTLVEKFPSAKYDSATSVIFIDSLPFSKFLIVGKEDNGVIYKSIMLGKLYKGYDFKITYMCVDGNIEKEIEEMLEQSKFSRL